MSRELPPPSLRARILEKARAVPSPTVADRRRGTILAACLAASASLLLSYRLGFPPNRSAGVLVAIALGGGVAALVATAIRN